MSSSSSLRSFYLVRSLRSIFCPDCDTSDKSTKLGTRLHKLFIIHSGWGARDELSSMSKIEGESLVKMRTNLGTTVLIMTPRTKLRAVLRE